MQEKVEILVQRGNLDENTHEDKDGEKDGPYRLLCHPVFKSCQNWVETFTTDRSPLECNRIMEERERLCEAFGDELMEKVQRSC